MKRWYYGMKMTTNNPQWLDRMYNNRALVPEFAVHMEDWQRHSEQARRQWPCMLDVSYGEDSAEKLDIFPAKDGTRFGSAPVLVFLHGGYWRSLDKIDHSFVAPAFVQKGACVVVPNYALCPGSTHEPVTVPHITMQIVKALAWVWRHIAAYGGDPRRISVVGHSAGGQLTAMMLTCLWPIYARDLPTDLVKNGLSISGLYELESIMHTPFLQSSLHLTPKQVLMASPAWLLCPSNVAGRGVLNAVVGEQESAEFLRQNQLIQLSWGDKVVPICKALPGLNHFSILEALVAPTHLLHHMACDLLFG
ncbi:MAG: hypothetical protein RL211_285 [Pseudomonadota bacterium]|jgi:arylformamidase